MEPTPIDTKFWSFVWDIITTIVVVVLAIYTWIVNRSKANRAAIDVVDEKVQKVEGRVDIIENDLSHLPTHEDLGKVHEKLNDTNKTLQELKGEWKTANKTLELINRYMIEKGDKQ